MPKKSIAANISFRNKQYPAVSMFATSGSAIEGFFEIAFHKNGHFLFLYCHFANGAATRHIPPVYRSV
ncbi:hypothetical protein C7N43_33845 [Sphingobacteriales bacterium UPWRP_1]|nr:hypothetical protein C7N43_33845 [Sphingobacteriales bacterium UPWRP_1]